MTKADAAELGTGRPHDTERPDIETSSDRYADRRFAGPAGRWLLAQQSQAIASVLDRMGEAPLRVLEVGGGHGQITQLLLERGHHVVVHGSDPVCFSRIESARHSYPDRLERCAASLRALPFADGSFDIVIAVRLLGHVTEWRAFLGELARLSRRFVVVEFPRKSDVLALQSLRDALFSLKHRVEGTTRPFFAYSEGALVDELQGCGFRRVTTVGQFALPMVAHRMLRSPALSAGLEQALRVAGIGDGRRSPAILLGEREHAGVAAPVAMGSAAGTLAAAMRAAAAAGAMLPSSS
jgi:SAM-dependent methyltransferase